MKNFKVTSWYYDESKTNTFFDDEVIGISEVYKQLNLIFDYKISGIGVEKLEDKSFVSCIKNDEDSHVEIIDDKGGIFTSVGNKSEEKIVFYVDNGEKTILEKGNTIKLQKAKKCIAYFLELGKICDLMI